MGDLASCWDENDKMLTVQFGEIQGSFGRNKTVLEHKYKKIKMMRELEGYVSRRALKFICDEFKRSKTFGFGNEDCGSVQKTSYSFGFPFFIIQILMFHLNSLFYLNTLYSFELSFLLKSEDSF